jgi:hypothetical protein
MKRLMFAAIALLLASISTPVLAQAPAAATQSGWSPELEQHFAGITLTADQKSRIIAAQKQHHAAIDKLNAASTDAAVTKKAVQAHMEAEHNDFKTIIGPEAYKTFEANMKKMMSGDGMNDMKAMKHDMPMGDSAKRKP